MMPLNFSEWILSISLALISFIVVFYLWALLAVYWLTRIRKNRQSTLTVDRLRDIAGFFEPIPPQDGQMWSCFLTASLATLVIILGCLLAYPATLGILIESQIISGERLTHIAPTLQKIATPIFFGFLGSYIFTLQTTLRRFLDSDLTPDAYVVVMTRMIIALIVSGMMGIALTLAASQQRFANVNLTAASYVIAFVVGIFPEKGLSWLISLAGRFLNLKRKDERSSLPLQTLAGLTSWDAVRLSVEGIANVQNLANADVNNLIRRTRFSVQQLFDWIDQAILAIHVHDPEVFGKLQNHGVRGFSDFQAVFLNDETRMALARWLSPNSDPSEGLQHANVLYAAMREAPSVDPVRLYWRFKDSYVTGVFEFYNRAIVLEGLERFAEAIDNYSEAIHRNTLEPTLFMRRGGALEKLARDFVVKGQLKEGEQTFERAINDYSQAIKLDPFATEAYAQRGCLQLNMERYEDAVNDFNDAIRMSKSDIKILNNRAAAFLKLAQKNSAPEGSRYYKSALTDLNRARKLDQQHTLTWVGLANAHLIGKKYEEAFNAVNTAISQNAEMPEAFHCRGRYYFLKNQLNYAIRDFQRAIDLAINEPEQVYVELGLVHLKRWVAQKDPEAFDAAVGSFRAATKVNKSFAQAYMERANAYRIKNLPDEAIKDYTTLVDDLKVEQAEVYINRGLAYFDAGNSEKALEDLNKGIDLDDKRIVAYINRGIIYEKQGKLLQALADFTKAIDLQHGTDQIIAPPYNNRGNVYSKLEQFDKAIEDFEEALNIDSRYAEAYSNLGEVHVKLGQPTIALGYFNRAIDLSPEAAIQYYNRGLAYLALNQSGPALKDFAQALSLNPDYTAARLSSASTHIGTNQLAQAREELNYILEREPNNSEAHYEYVRLEALLNNQEAVLMHFNKLSISGNHFIERLKSDTAFTSLITPEVLAEISI